MHELQQLELVRRGSENARKRQKHVHGAIDETDENK